MKKREMGERLVQGGEKRREEERRGEERREEERGEGGTKMGAQHPVRAPAAE